MRDFSAPLEFCIFGHRGTRPAGHCTGGKREGRERGRGHLDRFFRPSDFGWSSARAPRRRRYCRPFVRSSVRRPVEARRVCASLPLAPGHDALSGLPRYQIERANGCVIQFPMLPGTCGHFVVEILMRGRRQLRARLLFFGCVFIRRYPVPAIFSSLGYRTSAGPATTIKTPSLSCLHDRRADLPGAAFQMDGQSNELSDAPS